MLQHHLSKRFRKRNEMNSLNEQSIQIMEVHVPVALRKILTGI